MEFKCLCNSRRDLVSGHIVWGQVIHICKYSSYIFWKIINTYIIINFKQLIEHLNSLNCVLFWTFIFLHSIPFIRRKRHTWGWKSFPLQQQRFSLLHHLGFHPGSHPDCPFSHLDFPTILSISQSFMSGALLLHATLPPHSAVITLLCGWSNIICITYIYCFEYRRRTGLHGCCCHSHVRGSTA